MSFHNLRKGKHLLYKDLEGPILESRKNVLHHGISELPLVFQLPTSKRTALDAKSLKQQSANVHAIRQLLPAHQAQNDNAAIARRGVYIPLEVICSDKVNNQIDACPSRDLLNLSGPVLGLVVEGGRDTEFVNEEIAFFLGASRRIDSFGTFCFSELNTTDRDG